MIAGFVEAYNSTLKLTFRILDWLKLRPQKKLINKREELEAASRAAQIKGDVHELIRIRAQIEEIDRDSKFLSSGG